MNSLYHLLKTVLCLIVSAFLLILPTALHAQNSNTVYGAGWNQGGSSDGIQAYNYPTNSWNGSSLESLSYFTAPNTIDKGGPIAIDPINQNINLVTDATNPYVAALFTFGSTPTFVSFPSSVSNVTAQLLCSGYKPVSHICYYMSQNFMSSLPSPSNTGFFSIDFSNPAAPTAKNYASVLAPGSPFVNTTYGGDLCFDSAGTGYLVTAAKQLYTIVTDENAMTATFTYIASLSGLPFAPTAIAFDPSNPNSLTMTGGSSPVYANYSLATNSTTLLTNNAGWNAGDLASGVFPSLRPVLNVTKSLFDVTQNAAPPVIIGTGDIVEYTIVVKNTGNVNAGNLLIADTLPAGVTYIPGSTTLNGNPVTDGNGGAFAFTAPTTANSSDQASGSGILTTYATAGNPVCVLKYRVQVTAANNNTIVNNATATATGLSPVILASGTGSATFSVSLLATLPVSLLSFTATQADNAANIEWVTSNEANFSSFVVERSADGTNFQPIASVQSVTVPALNESYNSTDQNPLNGYNYYRLKEITSSGTFIYSQVRILQFNAEAFTINLYPNPARTANVTLDISTFSEVLSVRIMNIIGQVESVSIYSNAGGKISLDISRLSKGIHFISCKADGKPSQTFKLVIE